MPLSTAARTLVRPLDSWPSSPGRAPPSLDDDNISTDEDDVDIPSSHENPLTYFLTPATPKEEELEFEFDFEDGIEDSNHPRTIIRNVSPSTLDGLRKFRPKSSLAAECAVLDEDDDDDDEDYIRFRPQKSLPFGFENFFDSPPKRPSPTTSQSYDSRLSPGAFHVGSPRRPSKRFAPPRRSSRGRPSSLSLQRRHSWREPSPDVWSIDEEPEKETMSEMGLSVEDFDDGREKKTQPIDIPAAKPKKRVRFILPVNE